MDKKQALGVIILIIVVVLIYLYHDQILSYIKGVEHKSSTTHKSTISSSPEIVITYND